MKSSRLAVVLVAALALGGCRKSTVRPWEIAIENQSDVPCSVFVEMDGNAWAKVDEFDKGKVQTLVVGRPPTTVRKVTVTRNKEEQKLEPNVPLTMGKRYVIVVNAEGKVNASIAE